MITQLISKKIIKDVGINPRKEEIKQNKRAIMKKIKITNNNKTMKSNRMQ